MKKTLLTFITVLSFAAAHSQDVSKTTWPSTSVLPEACDWSIGFDAVPVITAVGNLFHAPSGNDSIFSQQQFTIVALHVKNDHTAYRFYARVGLSSFKFNNLVTDDASPTTQLTDTWTDNTFNLTLGAGIQKSRGKGRLRGIYGGEFAFLFGSHSDSYSYGNPYTPTDQTPTSTDFTTANAGGGFATLSTQVIQQSGRPIQTKDGFMFGFQLNAFLGVEYFFAPKMSISAEYAWGLAYASIGEATLDSEVGTGNAGTSSTVNESRIGSASAFNLDVINSTSLIVHFYF